MTTSRDAILKRLRAAQQQLAGHAPTRDHLPMVLLPDTSPGALVTRFIEQAEKLGCVVHRPSSEKAANQPPPATSPCPHVAGMVTI